MKTKILKISLILLLSSPLKNVINAQTSIGLNPNYKSIFSGWGGTPGLNIHNQHFTGREGNLFLFASMGFSVPNKKTSQVTLFAFNQSTSPSSIKVNLNSKLKHFFLEFGAGKIFGGDYEDGGFLASFSIELIPWRQIIELEPFDKTLYDASPYNNVDDDTNITLHGKIGLGYLIRTGSLGIIPNASLSLTASDSRSGSTSTSYPSFLELGVRLLYIFD